MRSVLSIVLLLLVSLFASAEDPAPEMEKLDFLIGDWDTVSTFPEKGLEVTGRLSYSRVIGGHWVLTRFVGKHPMRDFWEAVAMMRWDEESQQYLSDGYFAPGEPSRSTGTFVGKTLRFSYQSTSGTSGIDYSPTEAGVYQENWRIDADGKRVVTLQTVYTPHK